MNNNFKTVNFENLDSDNSFENDDINQSYPINIDDYFKYYILKNTTEEYMMRYINEYTEIINSKKKTYEFKYYFKNINNDKYIIIKCPDDMDFYNYHNLSSWFYGSFNENNTPELAALISINKYDNSEDYYAILDLENKCGDTLTGAFNNGTRFYEYLPEAFIENGNIVTCYNNLEFTNVSEYINSIGLNTDDLIKLEDRNYKCISFDIPV